MKHLHEILTILLCYADSETWEVTGGVLFLGGPPASEITPAHAARLTELNVRWSALYNCWTYAG